MNICFFLGGLYGGGIGRVTSFVADELAKNRSNHIFLLCYSKPENGESYNVCPSVKKDYLLNKHVNMRTAIKEHAINNLRNYLRENNIDVLINCGVLYSLISVIACKKEKVVCVNWEHTSMNTSSDFKFQSIIRWLGAHCSDISIVLTKETKRVYQKKYQLKDKRILQIYNPVDPAAYVSKKYNTQVKRIISVGRLCYQKKMEDAILAAELILPLHPDWRWDIYGDGDDYEKLSKMIHEKGLEGRVILMGRKNDIYERYKDYSFMVMTSRYEGFPMTLLEAAANRLPMVSYDIDTGPDEIIDNGENGYLIPADNVTELSNVIERLINEPHTRKALSEKSFLKAEEFDLKTITREWENLFDRLRK